MKKVISPISLWLDDERPAPSGWYHCKSAWDALRCLLRENVTEISLDHDLGDFHIYGDGYLVAKAIERLAHKGKLSRIIWNIHSQNPVGKKKMRIALQNADKYWFEIESKESEKV